VTRATRRKAIKVARATLWVALVLGMGFLGFFKRGRHVELGMVGAWMIVGACIGFGVLAFLEKRERDRPRKPRQRRIKGKAEQGK
jgi:hypothetical protein